MLYYKEESFELHEGKMQDVLDTFAENSIDSIVCDPPYGLTSITKRFGGENAKANVYGKDGSFARLTKGFMGKEWDGTGVEYDVNAWAKCYKVLKPGGYLLAFGGTRTFHRIACAIEDAGFEIRDTIMWLYGSGFPKSMNIGLAFDKKNGVESQVIATMDTPDLADVGAKQKELGNGHKQSFGQIENAKRLQYEIKQAQNEWAGWGTALKPAYEPIIVARKPFRGSLVDNIEKYKVGGINIDECRIDYVSEKDYNGTKVGFKDGTIDKDYTNVGQGLRVGPLKTNNGFSLSGEQGRFPSNVILTYDDTDKEEVCGGMPYSKSSGSESDYSFGNQDNITHLYTNIKSGVHYEDECSASRYFYCAKASKKDRDDGLLGFEEKQKYYCDGTANSLEIFGSTDGGRKPLKNYHPTVKPIELMQYLVRLVTPKGTKENPTKVLDCFMGSGSTGKAVMFENRERKANYYFIGIEMTSEYLPICKSRIEYGKYKYEYDVKQEQAESLEESGIIQTSIYDFMKD